VFVPTLAVPPAGFFAVDGLRIGAAQRRANEKRGETAAPKRGLSTLHAPRLSICTADGYW